MLLLTDGTVLVHDADRPSLSLPDALSQRINLLPLTRHPGEQRIRAGDGGQPLGAAGEDIVYRPQLDAVSGSCAFNWSTFPMNEFAGKGSKDGETERVIQTGEGSNVLPGLCAFNWVANGYGV